MTTPPGKAYLIGAGPGDPELLTLRGQRRLAEADLVLYDYLVNPLVLRWVRPGAELECLGRHGHGRLVAQEDINARMVAAVRAGRVVVRLKGGDPAVFARTAEEVAALEAAGCPYEVTPGVTAALAASSYAGIPLTHRDAASCVALITGQECRDKDGAALDMAALARFPGTLVFYMGVTTAPAWARALIDAGKSAATPVAVVRHASLPQQRTTITTLGELPRVLAPGAMRPPALVIVGEAVTRRATVDWFADRPLAGRTILVTRPRQQVDQFAQQLADLGANVAVQPAIDVGPPADVAALDAALARLDQFAWIVFSSANGVAFFLERLLATGRDLRALGGAQLAAIGPATAAALAERGLHADVQPDEYRAEALAAALAPAARDASMLLVRASRGREALAETLAAAGARVTQVVAYQSRDVAEAEPEIAAALAAGRIDWVTVTSSAIARSLVRLFGPALAATKVAAISPLTAEALGQCGVASAAVASQYTAEGLIAAILEAESRAPES